MPTFYVNSTGIHVTDASVNHNSLVYHNVYHHLGHPLQFLRLSSTANLTVFGDFADAPPAGVTLAAYVRLRETDPSGALFDFSATMHEPGGGELSIELHDGQLEVRSYVGNLSVVESSAVSFNDMNWHFVAVTLGRIVREAPVSVYVDHILVASSALENTLSRLSNYFHIGRTVTADFSCLAYFKYALTADELQRFADDCPALGMIFFGHPADK